MPLPRVKALTLMESVPVELGVKPRVSSPMIPLIVSVLPCTVPLYVKLLSTLQEAVTVACPIVQEPDFKPLTAVVSVEYFVKLEIKT